MGYEQCDSLEFFGGLGWVLLGVSVWSWWVFWACLFFKLFLNIYILIYILPVGLSLTRIAGDFGRDVLRGGRRGGGGCWFLKKKVQVLLSNLEGKSKLTSSKKQLGARGRRGEKIQT